MIITREYNGISIKVELTPDELKSTLKEALTVYEKEKIYREIELDYHTQDVEMWWKNNHNNAEPCPFSDGDKVSIAKLFDERLEDNEGYWEQYWDTMAQTIEEYTSL